MLDDLVIVIVLFRQSLLECLAYQSLNKALGHAGQFPVILVYDNSPESLSLKPKDQKLIYLHDSSNPGVSKAYNEGYKLARQLTKKWLLLVDQDTEFPSTIFSDYSNAIQSFPHIRVFSPSLFDSKGLVSPFRLTWGKGRRIRSLNSGIYSLKKFNITNSGLMISADAFEKAGGYDERFLLDYSDISFCERVSKDYPNFGLIQSHCRHHFSATSGSKDLVTAIARFTSFCKAAILYKKISIRPVILIWIIIPRALKLSLQMKDLGFLKVGIKMNFYN